MVYFHKWPQRCTILKEKNGRSSHRSPEPADDATKSCGAGLLSKDECIKGRYMSSMFGSTSTFCNAVAIKLYNKVVKC